MGCPGSLPQPMWSQWKAVNLSGWEEVLVTKKEFIFGGMTYEEWSE